MFSRVRQGFRVLRYRPLVLGGLMALAALPMAASAQQPLGRSASLFGFGIVLDANSAPAGAIPFTVNNPGAGTHELAVIKSDLAANALPAVNGVVDETKVTVLSRLLLTPGTSGVLNTNLAAGKYVLVCNRPRNATDGHYSSGMTIAFTVGASGAAALSAPSVPPVPVAAPAAAAAPAQAATPVAPKTGSAGLAGGQTSSMVVVALLAIAVTVAGAGRALSVRASRAR